MSVDYVESSAIAKLILDEPERAALVEHLRSAPGSVTSLLALVEVRRAAARRGPDHVERVSQAMDGFVLLELDRAVIVAAAGLQPTALRTLDAIHVASAQMLGAELRSLVTYDRRIVDAATALGIPVASPGASAR